MAGTGKDDRRARPKDRDAAARQDRRAAALRENLRKRKAQTRSRARPDAAPPGADRKP